MHADTLSGPMTHNRHLGGDLKSSSAMGEDDYLPINVKVACSDGKVRLQGNTAF